jgi:hypothetical protein
MTKIKTWKCNFCGKKDNFICFIKPKKLYFKLKICQKCIAKYEIIINENDYIFKENMGIETKCKKIEIEKELKK